MRRTSLLTAAALGALIISTAACSSSTTADPGNAPGSGSANGKSTILIGQIVGASGFNADSQGPSIDVAQAWAKWVNSSGGINGHPVEVISLDTKATATVGASDAAQLISKKVVAVAGSNDGLTEASWTPALAEAKIPVIGTYISNPFGTGSNPYWFPLTTGGSVGQSLAVDVAKEQGATKFGSVLCQEATGCQTAGKIFEAEADKIGLASGGYVQVAASAPNYNAACLTLKEKGVDFVQLGLSAEVAHRVVDDCLKQGFKPTYGVYGSPVNGADLVPLSKEGVTIAGFTSGFPWFSDLAGAKQYRDVMTQLGKNHTYPINGNQPNTWASLELVRKVLTTVSAANPTSADVYEALLNVKDEDLGGLLPEKVTFSADKPNALLNCAWSFKLVDGNFTGGKSVCVS